MTLILTIVTPHFVAQASDRRFTNGLGEAKDEDANKAIMLACRDADVMVAFTGLAEFGGKLTHFHLLDFLSEVNATTLPLRRMTGLLREWLTARFRPLNLLPEGKCLSVVMAGWSRPEYEPIVKVITNCEENGALQPKAAAEFRTIHVDSVPKYYFRNDGSGYNDQSWTLYKADFQKRIVELLRRDNHWENVQDYMRDIIWEEAESEQYKSCIGKNCMSAVLYRGDRSCVVRYYSALEVSQRIWAPALITDQGNGQISIAYAAMDGLPSTAPGVTAIGSGDPLEGHFRILIPDRGVREGPGLPIVPPLEED